jgi:L-lysine exporter family protein LysE/ArgO
MASWLAGLSVMLGLIVAIGAQNTWVLSMSVRRNHPWSIAFTCILIDSLLMAVGVASFQQIQHYLPGVKFWLTLAGILLLSWMAAQAFIRMIRGNSGLQTEDKRLVSRRKAILSTLMISLLNPHVYLDTVVLIGSLASASSSSWLFYSGALSASVIWFLLLTLMGGSLGGWLSSPQRWRIFDGVIGTVLTWVAFSMLHLV